MALADAFPSAMGRCVDPMRAGVNVDNAAPISFVTEANASMNARPMPAAKQERAANAWPMHRVSSCVLKWNRGATSGVREPLVLAERTAWMALVPVFLSAMERNAGRTAVAVNVASVTSVLPVMREPAWWIVSRTRDAIPPGLPDASTEERWFAKRSLRGASSGLLQ